MSSGNLPRTQHPELFRWSDDLDPSHYLLAHYRVTSVHDAEATAIGMAMEQSVGTTFIRDYVGSESLRSASIRVISAEARAAATPSEVGVYQLETDVYAAGADPARDLEIVLAIPLRLLQGKPAQLFNVVMGELPRLGFLTRFRLERCDLPAGFGPGPAFGVAGIRQRLRRPRGPLLCRSMRPGVGLDTATMAKLNRDVLTGGFHLVKDDELQMFADNQAYRRHVEAMVAARDAARDRSGEFKGYLTTLLCEPGELSERWDIACSLGVDAALVAPAIQGFGTLAALARQGTLPLLAHNTFADLWNRHPGWGAAPRVLDNWLQHLGADWYVTSGEMGAGADAQDVGRRGHPPPDLPRQAMPILQGGKRPEGLAEYRAAVGSDDFMLIVASWVDGHPDGLEGGARIFRDAVDASIA